MMVLTGLHPATAGALFSADIRMGGDGGRLHATTGRKNYPELIEAPPLLW